jgi:hypothetical protein
VAGIAIGFTSAVELNRVARGHKHYSLGWEAVFAAIRGVSIAVALYRGVGLTFAATLAVLITAGQIVGYSRGISPAMDYSATRRPRFTRRQFWGTVVRTFGYCAAALICGAIVHRVNWIFAIRIGVVTGLVTGVGQTINPYIEYYADNLPARRLGAVGIGIILCGFALQSFQYWVALFDVRLL